jgi:hypothetical protein
LTSFEVLSACNDNPKYLDCVEHYIDFWLLMNVKPDLVIRPKVVLIGSDIPDKLNHLREYIEIFDPGDLSSVAVSQIIRLLMPALSDADIVMTSDIDMVPLSSRIEVEATNRIKSNKNFFMNTRNVLPPGQFAICYNLASPETWSKVTGVSKHADVYPKLQRIISEFSDSLGVTDIHGGPSWYMDQLYLYEALMKHNSGISLQLWSDSETHHRRLDRAHHRFPLNWIVLPMLLVGYFHDYHVHHPVIIHSSYLKLLKTLIKMRNRFGNA